jgi:hypothetical protein
MAPNDGILSLDEATGPYAALGVEVSALHTFIMNSRQVVEDMLGTLETLGRQPERRK